MPSANIEVNAVAGSDDDVPINTLVQLSNADTGGEVSYLWEILDQPDGTADTLSSATIENPTFTPKKEGSYLIRLTVNDGLGSEVADTAIVAVRHLKTFERIPAGLETTEVDTAKGWKPATNRLLARADDVIGDANLMVCLLPGAGVPIVGSVVKFHGQGTIKTGLPGEERVPLVTLALGTSELESCGQLGVIVGTPNGGATVANGLAIVRVRGLVEVTGSGTPVVGDIVYLEDGGAFTNDVTVATTKRIIGRVVFSSAGVYRWVIDGSDPQFTSRREAYGAAAYHDASAGAWTVAGGTGVLTTLNWTTTSDTADGLVLPLKVRPGDVLYRLDLRVNQGSTSAQIGARIVRGEGIGGGSTVATVLSPATSGDFTWDPFTTGPVSPITVVANEMVWVVMQSVGGAGTARRIGTVTSFTRPRAT